MGSHWDDDVEGVFESSIEWAKPGDVTFMSTIEVGVEVDVVTEFKEGGDDIV